MSNENNKFQIDIENLFKQNVNDLLSIKELYKRIEELEEKITQYKYIDNTLVKKLKKEYEKLKKIILDENIQLKLTNDIERIKSQLNNNTINSTSNYQYVDRNLIKIQEMITNANKNTVQYFMVGDSTREFGQVFNKVKKVLEQFGVKCYLQAKSGNTLKSWSTATSYTQEGFPTVLDLIPLIEGDGSNCIVDIMLAINDQYIYKPTATVEEMSQYMTYAINKIKETKPNVKIILTSPHETSANPKIISEFYQSYSKANFYPYINVIDNVIKINKDSELFADNLHLIDEGYYKIADYILSVLIADYMYFDYDKKSIYCPCTLDINNSNYELLKSAKIKIALYIKDYVKKPNEVLTFFTMSNNWWIGFKKGSSLSTAIDLKNGVSKIEKASWSVYDFEGYIDVGDYTVLEKLKTQDISIEINFENEPISFLNERNMICDDISEKRIEVLRGSLTNYDSNNELIEDSGFKIEFKQTSGPAISSLYLKKYGSNYYIYGDTSSNAIGLVPMENGFNSVSNTNWVEGLTFECKIYIKDKTAFNNITDEETHFRITKNAIVNEFTGKIKIKDLLYKLI